jgi:O-acetylhomoserine (thiol)-lyase
MSVKDLEEAGISEGLIRLSIGIESVEDLIEDLEKGFKAAAKVS